MSGHETDTNRSQSAEGAQPDGGTARTVNVVADVLGRNEELARANRELFASKNLFVMNVMSSPGAGKTTFLVETIKRLKNRYAIGVVEGDVASQIDAERIRETGVPVVQVNTGGACHLDAGMVARALPHLPLDELDVVIIENVGNLVCPAEWNLGEHLKVTLLSIPEGDDKPIKYPLMFTEGDVLVLNKIDLLPYFSFDLEQVERTVRGFNPNVMIFKVSATRGDGLDEWLAFLAEKIDQVRGGEIAMDRDTALALVRENVPQANLVKHMLAAEAVMRALARRFGEDEEAWGLAGLLHDLDYAETADRPDIHALRTAEMLAEYPVDPAIVHAILAHNNKAPRDTLMAKALWAVDPLTGFLVACALMAEGKKIANVTVDFALRRFKEKAFARGASRDQMKDCAELGITLEEFIEEGLRAMQGIAGDLGL